MGKAGARDPGQACTRADAGRGCVRTSQCIKQSERGTECVNCVRETPRRTITWDTETPDFGLVSVFRVLSQKSIRIHIAI